eukprot:TRINITY_DN8725_c0_g1_i16.p1 TRINITY_DN8725_c0_g1~~TRINITY_DN8725_c0_g1_i16.p1  ORF type:complete len:147 (-),score=44.81 TRINITY_DN8725_c0_g1_i16:11-451(-)
MSVPTKNYEGILKNSPVHRYCTEDLVQDLSEREQHYQDLEDKIAKQEEILFRVVEEKKDLKDKAIEEERIRCQSEANAQLMQSQIDKLLQTIQDYTNQTKDLTSHFKQLQRELELLEITSQVHSEGFSFSSFLKLSPTIEIKIVPF